MSPYKESIHDLDFVSWPKLKGSNIYTIGFTVTEGWKMRFPYKIEGRAMNKARILKWVAN